MTTFFILVVSLLALATAMPHQSSQHAPGDTKKTPTMTNLDQPRSSGHQADVQAAAEGLESVKRALTSKFKKGERVILYRENSDSVVLAATETDFKFLINALKIGDKEGLYNLALADYLFLTANRTRGMVLDTDSLEVEGNYYPVLQVRILEGRERGRAGWISEKWVTKQ